jgi:kumamolisin
VKALTAISIAIGILTASLAQAAIPVQFPIEADAGAVDLGLAPQAEVRTVTLSLAPKDVAAMEAYAAATADPASPDYGRFLTPAEFGARFGQDATSHAQVVNFLGAQGLAVTRVYRNRLLITAQGTNAQLAAVFGSPIHAFEASGETYEAPLGTTDVPVQLAGLVTAVHGLNARPLVRSNARVRPEAGVGADDAAPTTNAPTPQAAATATPGHYTTADLAQQYNITPLYQAGITGAGKIIGIATFGEYDQADAYAYWNALGLQVNRQRITDVVVDGGPRAGYGLGSEGAFESTLDIQQAGGVAPGAAIRVYLGPNTTAGIIDTLARAVDDNVVDTLSMSWGLPELASGAAANNAMHTVFVQAAIQGIPVIVSSGDAGAYDVNSHRNKRPYPDCTTLLSVDAPASDPLVLAAGGTTLPLTRRTPDAAVTVTQERAWAWDYMRDAVVKYDGQAAYYDRYFPVGGGGGVSVGWARPNWQNGLAGVANTAPGQRLLCKSAVLNKPGTGYQPVGGGLPAHFAGRNLPDVSLNADPYSGYLLYMGGWRTGVGGTSVVAPQLNGIFTLIAAARNGRVGQIQPRLYAAFKAKGYGPGSPFRAITAGTNFYYASKANYNPATGLGSLDVANLARAFGVRF